jgi:hypothetical protein
MSENKYLVYLKFRVYVNVNFYRKIIVRVKLP